MPTPYQGARNQLSGSTANANAAVLAQTINPDDGVFVLKILLDNAADPISSPLLIGSYRSIYFAAASDGLATVNLRINSKKQNSQSFPCVRKDSFAQDLPWAQAYIDWPAQPGKYITIVCFRDGVFAPGSQLNSITGVVNVVNGSTFTRTIVSPTAGASAQLVVGAAGTLQVSSFNDTGQDLWIGEANTVTNTGATMGIKWPDQSPISFKNTGSLWVYNPSGSTVNLAVLTEA